MKRLVYIDLGAIYWKFYSNLRIFNLPFFISHIYEDESITGDEVSFYVFADFSEDSPLLNLKDSLITLKNQYDIHIINGYNKVEGKNYTDIALLNSLYQSFIKQKESYAENKYIFALVDTKYVPTLDFLQDASGQNISIYVADDFKYMQSVEELFDVHGYINVSANARSVFDKTIISQIFAMIRSGKKKGFNLTTKNVIDDCLRLSKIKSEDSMFMIRALTFAGYLERKQIPLENGNVYYALTITDENKADKFLSTL